MLYLQSNQALQSKHRIIQITLACTVFKRPILIDLGQDKFASKFCRFAEDLARKPSDLKHFKTKAHHSPRTRRRRKSANSALVHSLCPVLLFKLLAPAFDLCVVENTADDPPQKAVQLGVFQIAHRS